MAETLFTVCLLLGRRVSDVRDALGESQRATEWERDGGTRGSSS